MIRIVLSGGQTGVDRAAHRAAREAQILIAGRCPPGRAAEDGTIPAEFPLCPTPVDRSSAAPDVPRSLRTEWNVRDSDATLILALPQTRADPGTSFTEAAANLHRKPCLRLSPADPGAVDVAVNWIEQHSVTVLNIAGPGESSAPGIGRVAYQFLRELFLKTQRS